jgi:hypothetical protein
LEDVREVTPFLKHGEVSVLEEDRDSGQLIMSVVLPACVMQAVTPSLLGAGSIDSYELRWPLAAWVPTVADVGFRSQDTSVCSEINARVARAAVESLRAFADSVPHLLFPGDVLSVLPMGTYVRFRLRCYVDDLVPRVQAMGGEAGVAELKFALASEVAALLSRWGRTSEDGRPPAAPGLGRRRRRPGRGQGSPSA